tara:strand:+ start:337 stop:1410 length:1074 start_codon:yes stop_codon:yes gene_type:complete
MNSCIYYSINLVTNLVTIAIAQRQNILYMSNHKHFDLVVNLAITACASWEYRKEIGTLPSPSSFAPKYLILKRSIEATLDFFTGKERCGPKIILLKVTFLPAKTLLLLFLKRNTSCMKVADKVRNKIEKLPEGYVFGYDDFNIEQNEESALKVALFRLVKAGTIERLSKGRFYKPQKGIVGNLNPDEYEIVKDLLFENQKPIGYITGYGIFNRFGLTTQLSNVIQIGTNFDKKQIQRGRYKIKFVRQWNTITNNNIYLLQLLDCIRYIKNIPDATVNQSFQRLTFLTKELSPKDIRTFASLALNYPSQTRSLTGALLEKLNYNDLADKLFRSLKATTYFNVNISSDLIPNKQKWRIQ